ncbi:hypothetical protein GCM10009632_03910 [Mycolicibacterium alvei]
MANGRRLAVRSHCSVSVDGTRTGWGAISCMPAGVGGASVIVGVVDGGALLPHPATAAAAARTANIFRIALISGCLFFAQALISGTR